MARAHRASNRQQPRDRTRFTRADRRRRHAPSPVVTPTVLLAARSPAAEPPSSRTTAVDAVQVAVLLFLFSPPPTSRKHPSPQRRARGTGQGRGCEGRRSSWRGGGVAAEAADLGRRRDWTSGVGTRFWRMGGDWARVFTPQQKTGNEGDAAECVFCADFWGPLTKWEICHRLMKTDKK